MSVGGGISGPCPFRWGVGISGTRALEGRGWVDMSGGRGYAREGGGLPGGHTRSLSYTQTLNVNEF